MSVSSGEADNLIVVRGLVKHFELRRGVVLARDLGTVQAVSDVDLELREGETLGLVGETGSGKTTLARLMTRLIEPTAGSILYHGEDITNWTPKQLRLLRREMQVIFQDPYSSLNPRRPVGTIIAEPLRIHGIGSRAERKRRVREVMEMVGLNPEHYNRYPHEFSGGQRQRVGIARAIITRPKLIVADEPVSALDVSIQAQILNLLQDLRQELQMTLLIIAHDLAVVRHICDRIAVMYLGKVAELGPAEEITEMPRHPYAGALLSAVPVPAIGQIERRQVLLRGDPPSPVDPPKACRFHTRCPKAQEICSQVEPPLEPKGQPSGANHVAACHFPLTEDEVAGLRPRQRAQ